jgi:dTDP-4-amino-4,6-dideoxygalactose transaminase
MRVLDSGMLAQGAETERFERRFAQITGVRHAVATSSGTAALHLALMAHGVGPGDDVITTPFSFAAAVNCILAVGARPVFADIDEDSFNIDPHSIERHLGPRTRVILPVHLFGHPCDMSAIAEVARAHNLIVIEDCAQAIGASVLGRPVGTFDTGAFSFYATKNVTAGEAGMVTTDRYDIADRVRLLRNHGMRRRYEHELPGLNYRVSDIHAAIGTVQLERLDEVIATRRRNAAFLTSQLRHVRTPSATPGVGHVWHQYTIRTNGESSRDRAVAHLAERGIETGVFYGTPLHKYCYVRDLIGDVSLPRAESTAGEVFSIPVHPGLSDSDIQFLVDAVNDLPLEGACGCPK